MPATNEVRQPQRAAQRRSRVPVTSDRFFVDPDRKPNGMSYEFKRLTYGAKHDTRHQAYLASQGWTPVPAKRHPEIVGDEYARKNPEGQILVDGQILMERPLELTAEAAAEDLGNAKGQVSNQMRSLKLTPDGTMPRRVEKASRKFDIPVSEPDEAP